MSGAACVLQSSKRAPLPGYDLAAPLATPITPSQRLGHQSNRRGEHDHELRNCDHQSNPPTPYTSQSQPQYSRAADTASSTPTNAIGSIRLSDEANDFLSTSPSPPPPLDVHELDLTPRLVVGPGKRVPAAYHLSAYDNERIGPPLDELSSSLSSFVVTPRPAAAVYEQQPALAKRLSAQFKPLDLDGNLQTFKRNNGRMSGGRIDTVDSKTRQQCRGTATTTITPRAADCNSLDSFQSCSSTSSSVASPLAPRATTTTCQPLHRHSSVLIGTRYVRPPSVPPVAIAKQTTPTQTSDEWREVPLADFGAPVPDGTKSRGLKKCSLFWTRAKTITRTNKSGLNGASGGGSGGGTATKQTKSPETGKSLASVDLVIERDHHDRGRLQEAKVGKPKLKPSSKTSDKCERRRDSTSPESSGGAPSQPAGGQIGKSRAPFLFAGILGSILASLFFSLGLLTIKLLPDDHGLAEKTKIVCFRGLAIMILCAGTIVHQKSTFMVRRDELLINVLRSILGFTGIFGAYVALKYISMGDSTALVFSSPVWTSLLSHFILNEPLQWIQLVALPLSIVGIVLIAHPSLLINIDQPAGFIERQPDIDVVDDLLTSAAVNATNAAAAINQDSDIATNASEHFDYEHRWKGILIALLTSFIVSFVYIVLKFRKTTPIQTTTFWLGFTTFVGALALSCIIGFGSWPASLKEWALLIINGVCSWLGQCLLQWALKYEDASVLSVVRTLDVAMTFTLSALFLNEQILWTSILGAAIIATVVVSIMLNNYISSRLCPTRAGQGLDEKTGGSSLRSSVTLSTGEPSGEPLDDLPGDQVANNKTARDSEHQGDPKSRHASVAA